MHKLFDKTCYTKGIPGFKNEGTPYGTMVAMKTYMIQIMFDHKENMCLELCYNIKAV